MGCCLLGMTWSSHLNSKQLIISTRLGLWIIHMGGGAAYQALPKYLSLVKEFEVVGRRITGQSFENKLLLNSKILNGTSTLPLPSPRDRIERHEKGSVIKHWQWLLNAGTHSTCNWPGHSLYKVSQHPVMEVKRVSWGLHFFLRIYKLVQVVGRMRDILPQCSHR